MQQGTGGTSVFHSVDPLGKTQSPLIELGDAHFAGTSSDQISYLWGELYHDMDFVMSGRPTTWYPQIDRGFVYDVCLLHKTHSGQYGQSVGWDYNTCSATFNASVFTRPDQVKVESPANLVEGSGNYAARGPHEDFAHTYQVLTQQLVAGEEVCGSYLADPLFYICVKSNTTSSMIQKMPGFWMSDSRLDSFRLDALAYGANLEWNLYLPWEK